MAVNVDYAAWRFWMDFGQWVFSFIIAVYVWVRTRRKSIEDRIVKARDEAKNAITKHGENMDRRCAARLKMIEGIKEEERQLRLEIAKMPSQNDIKNLSERIDILNGGISELSGRLKGINRAVDLINEFLINQGGKGVP